MAKVEKVTQVTHNRFLNYFQLSTIKRTGDPGTYYMSSRALETEQLDLITGENTPNGVVIYSLYGKERDQVVLVRQFRYPIADYVYELPAGLIEPGENYREAAVREMREETGTTFTPLEVDPMFERPFYNSIGMTDESCCLVYGYSEGAISCDALEDSEELEVVLADRAKARQILKSERVAANCAYMLMHFLSDREPFAFLGQSAETD